jgi:phosphohistidine phosphatase
MTARVVLMRHAKPQASAVGTDAERSLSEEGKETQRLMAKKLREEGIAAHSILHSPLLRAQQSAAILVSEIGGVLRPEPALGEEFDAETLLRVIQRDRTIVMVGHDPTLANFANQLLGRNQFPEGLAKSGAVIIDFPTTIEFGSGKLLKYLTPS